MKQLPGRAWLVALFTASSFISRQACADSTVIVNPGDSGTIQFNLNNVSGSLGSFLGTQYIAVSAPSQFVVSTTSALGPVDLTAGTSYVFTIDYAIDPAAPVGNFTAYLNVVMTSTAVTPSPSILGSTVSFTVTNNTPPNLLATDSFGNLFLDVSGAAPPGPVILASSMTEAVGTNSVLSPVDLDITDADGLLSSISVTGLAGALPVFVKTVDLSAAIGTDPTSLPADTDEVEAAVSISTPGSYVITANDFSGAVTVSTFTVGTLSVSLDAASSSTYDSGTNSFNNIVVLNFLASPQNLGSLTLYDKGSGVELSTQDLSGSATAQVTVTKPSPDSGDATDTVAMIVTDQSGNSLDYEIGLKPSNVSIGSVTFQVSYPSTGTAALNGTGTFSNTFVVPCTAGIQWPVPTSGSLSQGCLTTTGSGSYSSPVMDLGLSGAVLQGTVSPVPSALPDMDDPTTQTGPFAITFFTPVSGMQPPFPQPPTYPSSSTLMGVVETLITGDSLDGGGAIVSPSSTLLYSGDEVWAPGKFDARFRQSYCGV